MGGKFTSTPTMVTMAMMMIIRCQSSEILICVMMMEKGSDQSDTNILTLTSLQLCQPLIISILL